MKILHLAAGNRWTGAAAPAFAEVEALRAGMREALRAEALRISRTRLYRLLGEEGDA